MKAYVVVTGTLFGLLTLVHVWRGFVEEHLAADPWYVLTTVLSAALCVWAFRLYLTARSR